jgi:hypothetical protein
VVAGDDKGLDDDAKAAGADLFGLGHTFVLIGSALTILLTLWLFVWCFARSYHVERRLQAGLEVDEPQLSILANFRDLGPAPSKS